MIARQPARACDCDQCRDDRLRLTFRIAGLAVGFVIASALADWGWPL
ncbi:hypothetical protein [Sphingomonas sp. LT1P40]